MPPPNLYNEYSGELKAKADMAPNVYAAEAQYDPQYANLNLTDFQNILLGSPGTSTQVPVTTDTQGWINDATGQFTTTDPATNPANMMYYSNPYDSTTSFLGGSAAVPWYEQGAMGTGGMWRPYTEQNTTYDTVNTGATPGLLNVVGQAQQVTDRQGTQSQLRQASGDISNLQTLGPAGISAVMGADPGNASLMNALTTQAQAGVDAGTGLTPAQMRLATQTARQGQADRGMGYGPSDVYGEALGVSQYAQNLYQQRMQTGQSVAQQRYNMYGAPVMNMVTQTPQNYLAPYMNQGYGISSQVGPRLFGSDINAQDTFNTAYNGQVSQANAAANNSAAMTSAGISAGAGVAAAGLMALALA